MMLIYVLFSTSEAALGNNTIAYEQDSNRQMQMISDSIESRSFFEKNNMDRLLSQLEYEKSNSNMLEQTILEKNKLLITEKLKRKQIHQIYGSGISLLVLIVVLMLFLHRKALKNNTVNVEAKCKKEFDSILVRENVRVQLETLENERDRISRNLHDGISNSLVSIRLHLRSMDDLQPAKMILSGLAEDAHREIRAIMHNLSSPSLSSISFERLFCNHIEMMNYRKEMLVEGILLPELGWSKLNERTQTELYRLLQEITGNIMKHAQAKRVTVTFRMDEDCIVLIAEDDGVGILADHVSFGFGMRNLNARIEQLNGDLQVNSSPEDGTVFRISIPINFNSIKESHCPEKIDLLTYKSA